ncbi:MAG: hypothetical protein NT106_00540 [Candidatus Sumerlaeota bacterium]|nr:hypothetical protein [Candidatus Sumerlaeota bacterium]
MGKINNLELTLANFLAQKLGQCGEFRALTGILSIWGLDFLLRHLAADVPILIVAGNLAPDMIPPLETAFSMAGSDIKDFFVYAIVKRRVRLWYQPKVHLKVYIIKRRAEFMHLRPGFVVIGSSNLTKNGMVSNLEQCDMRRGLKAYELEMWQFSRCQAMATEITKENWPQIRESVAARWPRK